MVLSTAAFERAGVHLDPDELDRLVADAVGAVLPATALGTATELTAEEVAALERGGLRTSPSPERVRHVLARSAAEYAALVGTAYTVAEAARRLGIDQSRVRHRLGARTLYGIRNVDGWRLPRFQFDGDQLVPNIGRVLTSLDPGLDPISIARWFSATDPDLTLDGLALSPRDWLMAGGDAERVVSIASGLDLIA